MRRDGQYGKWICGNDAVVRIDNTLFLPGGLSPKYGAIPLSELNKRIRKELSNLKLEEDGITVDPHGPLWYRGLALGSETELAGHVEALLRFYGVRRIVLGHTPTGGSIVSRSGGKVILADVGLSPAYGGHLGFVLIENGRVVGIHGASGRAESTVFPAGQ